MGSEGSNQTRPPMDGETAIAFAADCFEKLHPKSSCPEWLARCTGISYHFDDEGNYVVAFAVTPVATGDAVPYFEVLVNASTGSTSVLTDKGVESFTGGELQGYGATSA